jgi:hypothetical protein
MVDVFPFLRYLKAFVKSPRGTTIREVFDVATDDEIIELIARNLRRAAELVPDRRLLKAALGLAGEIGYQYSGDGLAGMARLLAEGKEGLVRDLAARFGGDVTDGVFAALSRTRAAFSDAAIEGMMVATREVGPRSGIVDQIIWAAQDAWQYQEKMPRPKVIVQTIFELFQSVAAQFPRAMGLGDLAFTLGQFFTKSHFGAWHQLEYLARMRDVLSRKLGVSPGAVELLELERRLAGTVVSGGVARRAAPVGDSLVRVAGRVEVQEVKSFAWEGVLEQLAGATDALARLREVLAYRSLGRNGSFRQLRNTYELARQQGWGYRLIIYYGLPPASAFAKLPLTRQDLIDELQLVVREALGLPPGADVSQIILLGVA